jgi:hypothetical protein
VVAVSFACNAGLYSAAGALVCTACNAGTWSHTFGASQCNMCNMGTWSSSIAGLVSSVCIQCNAGTWSSTIGSTDVALCNACNLGTWSFMNGANSILDCVLVTTTPPTTTSTFVDVNACLDYPCSVFSSGCTDLPFPAGNSPSGRTCSACNAGFVPVNDTCRSVLAIPGLCSCPADSFWLETECNSEDSAPCPNGVGYQARLCRGDSTWEAPNVAQCQIAGLNFF